MGEVYRAEDLRLHQSVALKFLPKSHASDPEYLEHLVQEVRLARQVAHPNVCRVYDFIDTGSEQFVAMEYVDGESLAALVRRVGRLPQARTIGLAHQIVRGLAAVHERGVLHRDLKPDNVMVDGRGYARLMDFGVASLSRDTTRRAGMFKGTPAYVAPEQFLGAPPSSRTDVYALGVLLYELVTGRLPFIARTLEELIRRMADEEPPRPSALVPDVDPALEALILRCLDKDPAARPASARAVAEGLPGGDVLDVAVATGDTPDREVVAAALDAGALSRSQTWLAFGVTVASLLAFALLLPGTSLLGQIVRVRPPEALAERCRAILREVGWKPYPGETASGFGTDWSRYHTIGRNDSSARRWDEALRGFSPLNYYYRHVGEKGALKDALVERPQALAAVVVDHAERLIALDAAPALSPPWPSPAGQVDWRPLFVFAGLDAEAFHEIPPRLAPGVDYDRRIAWEGPFPGDPGLRVHVEAASIGGRLASFRALHASAVEGVAGGGFERRMALGQQVEALLLLLPFVPAVWLALRHLRLGRVDRQGSLRLAVAFLASGLAAQLLRGAPLVRIERGALTAPALGEVLLIGGFAWLLYMAAEPYVRRRWPRALVGWARLVGGRFFDPVVGRDVLLGVLAGAASCVLLAVIRLPAIAVVMPPLPPFMPNGDALASRAGLLAEMLLHGMKAVAFGLTVLVALVVLRSLVRSERLAVAIALLAVLIPHVIYVVHQPLAFIAVHFLVFFPSTVLIRRAGLLAFVVFYFSYSVLVDLAGSADPTTWTGRHGLGAIVLLGLLAVFGLYASLGRRLSPLRPATLG
jgi:serine/threonine-protein kinase